MSNKTRFDEGRVSIMCKIVAAASEAVIQPAGCRLAYAPKDVDETELVARIWKSIPVRGTPAWNKHVGIKGRTVKYGGRVSKRDIRAVLYAMRLIA